MRGIVIVTPESRGGVRYLVEKLVRGLRSEGFLVERLPLRGNVFIQTINDLANASLLRECDAVIYTGSIPRVSSLIARSRAKVLLFVHGFILHEIAGTLKASTSLSEMASNLYSVFLWNIGRALKVADLYICHSITSCEENGLKRDFVLLPQYIFPEELEEYIKFGKALRDDEGECSRVRVVTYSSFAISPRLLSTHHVVALLRDASRMVGSRSVELTVVDPRLSERKEERWGNLIVRYVKFLPRREFLKLLASADLYMERCIDEELRISSIEAGLLGTPVVKLTHPKFVARQDYGDEVIWSSSPRGLIDTLADYIANVEYWKPYYAKKLRNFLATRRNWDSVKEPLVNFLKA